LRKSERAATLQCVISVTPFLTSLWQQGALVGTVAKRAFYVRCDAGTTTQADIDEGQCNPEIGFAAPKPAEFVIVRFRLATLSTAHSFQFR
jgi:phage tail sheath protein FI